MFLSFSLCECLCDGVCCWVSGFVGVYWCVSVCAVIY